ncbi:MAG: hypothetical protein M1838_002854 [Thelocarpon superellum]|nr:MAG: hypothetical protein M1838_002854 [Thelocarpon superellum]
MRRKGLTIKLRLDLIHFWYPHPNQPSEGGPSEKAQGKSVGKNSKELGSQAVRASVGAASLVDSMGPGQRTNATTSVMELPGGFKKPSEREKSGKERIEPKGKAAKAADEDGIEAESAAANATSSSTSSAMTPPPSMRPSPKSPNPPPSVGQNPPSSDSGSSPPPQAEGN